jgi:hypothetical protein
MKKTTPLDFFLNIGIIITLYTSIITILALVFSLVDVAFPRVDGYPFTPSISWPVAVLIIVVPIFLILSKYLKEQYKWFIYVTLFLTGLVIASDLITVLYYFLDGQILTLGFIIKVLAVFIVAGSVFKYYFFTLRQDLWPKSMVHNTTLWTGWVIFLALLSIISGFLIIGSPRTQRLTRYDEMKVSDLQSIQYQIINYWQQKAKLPQDLQDISDPLSNFFIPTDPETGTAYEYQKVTATEFKLCAEFNKDTKGQASMVSPTLMKGLSENWQHSAGRYCFDRTIDPELYPTKNERLQP